MQEIRHDGSEQLTENASTKDLERAMADVRNASVALHKPGAVFRSKGRTLQVTNDGKIKELRKKRRQFQRQARKRGRSRR